MTEPPFGRFFLPGPTEVHPDILRAMLQPMIPHRGSDMTGLLSSMTPKLQRLFRTEEAVLIGTCAATGFMELAIRSGVRHRVLSLVGGAFGNRFAAIGRTCGRDVVRLEVAPGDTIEPDMLRDALQSSEVDAVTMVHSETSTGALAPLPDLAAVVREFDDVVLLVDAVTSLGGSPVETDEWGLDFVFAGSQKALALPPGISVGVASPRMLERARSVPERGAYMDVVAYHEAAKECQPTNTPAISTYYALAAQLDRIDAEGGVEARWERHDAMRRAVERWVAGRGGELGLGFLPRERRRSWTVSCLVLPEPITGREVTKAAAMQGWVIGSGYGELKERSIRIGHMGDHSVAGVDELLGVLEGVLS